MAIHEKHYNLIPIFQNHVFEQKMQRKLDAHMSTPDRCDRITASKTKATDKTVQLIKEFERAKTPDVEASLLTPNRTNFNLQKASPYLININLNRPRVKKRHESIKIPTKQVTDIDEATEKTTETKHLESKECIEIIEISDSDGCDDNGVDHGLVRNLFELTQENIGKHLSMIVKKKRKDSLIDLWRKKVNESRHRKSIMPIDESEIEAYLSENTEKAGAQSIESSHPSVETVIPNAHSNNNQQRETETDDSFFTAADDNVVNRAFTERNGVAEEATELNKDAKNSETIFQTQEMFEHFDSENNIVFYENKLRVNAKGHLPCQHAEVLNTSSESGTCTEFTTPTDYDTDNLRQELKAFGDVPGPITKNTKKLYLKRLVRYKRRPQQFIDINLKNETKRCEYFALFNGTLVKF